MLSRVITTLKQKNLNFVKSNQKNVDNNKRFTSNTCKYTSWDKQEIILYWKQNSFISHPVFEIDLLECLFIYEPI